MSDVILDLSIRDLCPLSDFVCIHLGKLLTHFTIRLSALFYPKRLDKIKHMLLHKQTKGLDTSYYNIR